MTVIIFIKDRIKKLDLKNKTMHSSQALKTGRMSSNVEQLPQIHHTVPRRYEETRPVVIQGSAHSKILGLGHELITRQIQKAEDEKQQAIRAAEEAVWEEAEKLKAIALEKAQEEAALEQEKVIKKMKKAHAKALLEEALKVEMAMQKLAIEQVKQERAEGEKRLADAVKETKAQCHKELLEAVAKARAEEKKIAADEAAKVAKASQEKFDTAMTQAANEKAKALKELRDTKDLEKACAVQDAEERERRISKEKCAAITRQFEAVIKDLKLEIENNKSEIRRLKDNIAELENSKGSVENCLVDTRKDFQDFIDYLPPFEKFQADFLIPIVYLDELEKKGYTVKSLRSAKPKQKTKKK